MNTFEKILLDFAKIALAAGPAFGPIFIHSSKGVAIFNASEATISTMLEAVQPAPAAPPQS